MPDDERRYEEEQTYTKVDKRRVKPDTGEAQTEAPQATEQAKEPATESPAEAEPPTTSDVPEEQATAPAESHTPDTLAEVGVYGILRFCVTLLSQQAWIALGIQAIPGHDTKENLPEAKVAIDTLAFLAEKLAADFDEAEKRELESLLANLRVNYVKRAG